MSVRLATAGTGAPFSLIEMGFSNESVDIKHRLKEMLQETREPVSFSWRETLCNELDDIAQGCSVNGWDGYDAEVVSMHSVATAQQLIDELPEHILVPDVVPEPSGGVALEWRSGEHKYFSVSVSGTTLIYAGIFGAFKKYGEERFFGAMPATILHILSHYFAEVR